MTEQEARDWMGLDWDNFRLIEKAMLKHESKVINGRSADETYVRYILDQTANVRDLNKMVRQFHTTKQYNAMVGAIRLRSDIADKILTRGQEFGIIDKVPEEKRIIAGLVVAGLDNKQLQSAIARELAGLNALMLNFGDATNVLDITPGQTHRALPAGSTEAPKRTKARNSRRAGGRRRVRKASSEK